jgi:type IV pilus assembly protein PilP
MITRVLVASTALGALLLAGCSDKISTSNTPPPPVVRSAAAPDAGAGPSAASRAADYSENDFVESDRNRDPFRSFVTIFVEKSVRRAENQRIVVLEQYSIDELKLVAIVNGGEYPRAMVVDPTTKGWVIKKGDSLGRPDIVHTGGTNGADYQLNWRVDRVRDGDVVLIRQDPAQPGIAPATRVIPLHPESENRDKESRL